MQHSTEQPDYKPNDPRSHCVITQQVLRYNATADRIHLFVSRSYFSCVRDARSKHHSHDDIQVIMMPNETQVKPRLIWLIVIIRYTYADVLRTWTGLMIENLCRCDLIRIWIMLGCINSDSHLPVQCWSSSVANPPRDDPQMIQIARTST